MEEIYIPKDLDEAVQCIMSTMTTSDRVAYGKADPSEFHFTNGMALRNNWGLWSGGPLKNWFVDRGVFHADDMSSIILDALKCKINNSPFNLDDHIKYYQKYWKDNYNIDERGNELT